ncbi:MAG: ATP-binding protein [Polaribacter sp.]
MKEKIFILLFFITFFNFSQHKENIYSKLSSTKTELKTNIKKVVSLFDNNQFKKKETTHVYTKIGPKTLWHHFKINPSEKESYKYFTIDNSYLPYGKIYTRKGNKIDSLHRVSNYIQFPHKFIFYKDPVWKIKTDSILSVDVFLKIENSSGRTRLSFFLESENQFLKRIESEYALYGLFIAFLISMTLILLFFSILKKEYAVIFYAIYIVTVLIEFLAGKGLGVQFFWSENSFLINNSRSLSQTLGVLCMGIFYYKFYKFSKNQKISKNIFKWSSFLTIPILFIYCYKFFFGGFTSLFLTVWIVLQLIIFVWLINHIYLTVKKQLPIYLVVAFILPIAAIIYGQSTNPNVNNPLIVALSGPSLYYVALSIEIVLFTWFIFGSVIESQRKYTKLKKASDELKYDFQNQALEIQHKERNKLVSNVHDTFGGYLEALKLRLLQKTENTPEKVQEILDAFYKEYRYLLNSLYAPKINSDNFTESLSEFCQKINKLTKHDIVYNFNVKAIEIPQEKCVHIYRILSELTTNAIKHSQANSINIKINQPNKETVFLEVSDDGIGFDKNLISKKGFGLNNIETRVKQINGFLDIESNKNGSVFKIEIPLNDK